MRRTAGSDYFAVGALNAIVDISHSVDTLHPLVNNPHNIVDGVGDLHEFCGRHRGHFPGQSVQLL